MFPGVSCHIRHMTDGADMARARQNALTAMRVAEKPLNAAELARRASVDVKTVRDFLSGKRWPHVDTLAKIDRALGQPEGTIDAWARGDDDFHRVAQPETRPRRPLTLDEAGELELARALVARLEARL